MGGAVSTGRNNDDLVDNLLDASYIRTAEVQKLFRAVDRADYFLPQGKKNAYKDLAWKSGNLHLSAPCIYSEVVEGLCLKPNLSFLNLGSGTGYLSTMVGLAIGSGGINHGVEIHPDVIEYANRKLEEFKRCSSAIDEYDLCEPIFVQGNCLCLSSSTLQYDRVYCGGACPPAHINYVKNLIKVGGILVMPVEDQLIQMERTTETSWEERSLLPVSFATLILPEEGSLDVVNMMDVQPSSLQEMCRTVVRSVLRNNMYKECPKQMSPKRKRMSKKKHPAKRSIIPHLDTSDEGSDGEELQVNRSRSSEHCSGGIQSRSIGAFIDIVLGRIPDVRPSSNSPLPTEQSASTQNIESDNKTERQENNEDGMENNLQESPSSSNNTTSSQTQNPQDNSNGTVIARIMIRKRNRDVGIEEEDENSEEDCSTESNNTTTMPSKTKTVETSSATKTKREKFDSGLGDEIDSSSSESEAAQQPNDQRIGMDVDSSADTDCEDEPKSHTARGKLWRTVTVPTYAVDHLLGHLDDESVDEDSEPVVPRLPEVGPYTILMRSKIQALPLPQTLKRYLNYYREL